MSRTTVGILRGGPSHEFDVSLKTGAALLNALSENNYKVLDIFIDKEGVWHQSGRASNPNQILRQVDVVLNGLHGAYGEDGAVQRLMDRIGVPYAGSRSVASAMAMHKAHAQNHLSEYGIRMPKSIHLNMERAGQTTTDDLAQRIFTRFGPPYVVKPANLGSSMGVAIVKSIYDLPEILAQMLQEYDHILVQEFIPGIEATVGVIDDFRGNDFYALPPIEISHTRPFFDYDAKYAGGSVQKCPSSFSSTTKKELEEIAKQVHRAMGVAHYSRSDFIVHPSGRVYFLELNTLPGLTEQSLVPLSLGAVGSSLPELAEHLVRLARN